MYYCPHPPHSLRTALQAVQQEQLAERAAAEALDLIHIGLDLRRDQQRVETARLSRKSAPRTDGERREKEGGEMISSGLQVVSTTPALRALGNWTRIV
jgi:hypothetical protein